MYEELYKKFNATRSEIETTTHVVSFWYVPMSCEDRITILLAFFSSLEEAEGFKESINNPPECPILDTIEDYRILSEKAELQRKAAIERAAREELMK